MALLRGFSGSDKSKDDPWKVNEQLYKELTQAQEEYKRLRGVIDVLGREYEDSKEVDYIRRYGMLKGMIKRTIMHLKLKDDTNHLQPTSSDFKKQETKRKRTERIAGLSAQAVTKQNEEVTNQIKEFQRKISMITDLIEQMERSYDSSKRYIVIQRYRLMKNIIKRVTHNQWI